MVKIRRLNIIIVIAAAVIFFTAFTVAAGKSGGLAFSPESSYTVIADWYNNIGRRKSISELEISSPVTLTSKLGDDSRGKSIIIKSNDLRLTLSTEGKIIYSSDGKDSEYKGERITVIPADDIKIGKDIMLRLTPIQGRKGRVTSPVYLAAKNDYFFTLIHREKTVIASVFALFEFSVICAVLLCFLRCKKHLFYIILASLNTALIILCKSNLRQFIFDSCAAWNTLTVISYFLIVVSAFGFILSFIKAQNKKPPLSKRLIDNFLFRFNL